MKRLLLIILIFGVLFSWFIFVVSWQNWSKNFDKDWERIVKITEKIIPPASIWQIIWPASFGIAASAFVSTFTIIEKDHPNKTICYGIALVFLILGIFGLIIDITQRKI